MKWFKHLTGSRSDPDIGAYISEFGFKGFYMFWTTIEVMADEFDIDNPGKNTFKFSWFFDQFSRKISRKTLLDFLEIAQKKRRIYFKLEGKEIYLNCPKLKELTDNYTKQMLKDLLNKLQRDFKETSKSHARACIKKKEERRKTFNNKNIYEIYFHYKKKSGFIFCDLCLLFFLIQGIEENDPKAKPPGFESTRFLNWLNEIRLTRTIDNRSREEILGAILFSQRSSFWKANIKSAGKLRDKIATLLHQIAQELERLKDNQTYIGGRGLPAHIKIYISAIEKRDEGAK